MKTAHASLLAVISLSLALCACDSGDKDKNNSTPVPAVPPKTPKPKAADDTGNPQPPESTEKAKEMNGAAVPTTAGSDGTDFNKFPQVDMINGAISTYATKMLQQSSMTRMADVGKLSPEAQKKKMLAEQKKAAGAGIVTDLDQLVKAGLMKSIPTPPEGKKYVLDVKEQKVHLE